MSHAAVVPVLPAGDGEEGGEGGEGEEGGKGKGKGKDKGKTSNEVHHEVLLPALSLMKAVKEEEGGEGVRVGGVAIAVADLGTRCNHIVVSLFLKGKKKKQLVMVVKKATTRCDNKKLGNALKAAGLSDKEYVKAHLQSQC